jgi:hypothetical protein
LRAVPPAGVGVTDTGECPQSTLGNVQERWAIEVVETSENTVLAKISNVEIEVLSGEDTPRRRLLAERLPGRDVEIILDANMYMRFSFPEGNIHMDGLFAKKETTGEGRE